MTMTTIKVSTVTRDRLKSQAAAARQSLGAYLETLADLSDRRSRLDAMRRSIEATSETDLASYRTELQEWSAVDGGN